MTPLSFLVFADFHYKQGMYASTVHDLQAILSRADAEGAELILHGGDFCNDYPGSPEVVDLLLQNPAGLPVYGCYGNHELETAGTAMSFITPRLTNRPVIWGTANGEIGDGSVGHYYFDHKDYRFVITDTNYSLNADNEWEHNLTGSHCPAKGNQCWNSLGPDQLSWLEDVLMDAARKGLHCIVVSHTTFGDWRTQYGDATVVRALLAKVNRHTPGTVIMAINGHHHTDGWYEQDGVLYFDVNAVRNAWWNATPHEKYAEDAPTFSYIEYDENGKPASEATQRPLLSLRQGSRTLFTEDPLSAMVTIDAKGNVTVCGTKSAWMAGRAPDTNRPEIMPEIRDRTDHIRGV